jgi:hypothetical protein
MPNLRIENVNGEVLLIDDQGEVIPADIVTIKIQAGQPTLIKFESKDSGKRFGSYELFFANAADGK